MVINPLYVVETGYETPTGEWDEYSSYVNVEGLDINSPVCTLTFLFCVENFFKIVHSL